MSGMWSNVAFAAGDVVYYRGRQFYVRAVSNGMATLLDDEGESLEVLVSNIDSVRID